MTLSSDNDKANTPEGISASAPEDGTGDTIPVNIVEDYPESGITFGEDYDHGRAETADPIAAAFDEPRVTGRARANRDGSLPRASRFFPFGVKERPARKKFDLKSAFFGFFGKISVWTNLGPVIVLALLIYSMVYVIAEKPYIMLFNGEQIAFVNDTDIGDKLLERLNLEMSAPYPAEANFRQYGSFTYTREEVKIKTKVTDDQEILNALRSRITWFIDAWTISVSNERTVYLPTKAAAERVLEDVKKSYLPEGGELTLLNAEFVENVELIKEEIPITSLGTPEQAFKTLTEGREPIREYTVQKGDTYWSIAKRNNMSVDELKLINGTTSDRLTVGQVLVLNIPKPLLSVRASVS